MVDMGATEMIAQVGFPIFICLWFMLRTEKVINNNTRVMTKVEAKL